MASLPRVLVIEDVEDDVAGLAWYLRRFSATVGSPVSATTLAAADRLIRDATARYEAFGDVGRPKLVILDLDLNGEPGESLIPALREEFAGTPIFVVSGTPDRARIDRVKAMRPDLYLSKSVDADLFLDSIERVLGKPPAPADAFPVLGGGAK